MFFSIISNQLLDLFNSFNENKNSDCDFPIPMSITTFKREYEEEYFLFFLHFVSVVVGKKEFDDYSWKFGISKFVNVSNEAFALLIFENNFERWFNQAVSDNWSSSTIKPMYTTGGNVKQTLNIPSKCTNKQLKYKKVTCEEVTRQVSVDSSLPTTAKYQGWSVQGIKRFNELYGQVEKERSSRKGLKFESDFLEFCMNGKESTKQKHMKQKNMVYEPCRHNLFEQDETSSSLGPDSDEKRIT